MSRQSIFGTSLLENLPLEIDKPLVTYPGKTLKGINCFQLDEDLLARHILLLGGSGCGKTNAFFYTLGWLRKTMTDDDVAIIFDTKGEFYDMFWRPGDYVIGNSKRFHSKSYTWNLFDEIFADGEEANNIILNVRELASALFKERTSSTQPFFCNAAKDIFAGIILHFVRQYKLNPAVWCAKLNNASLLEAFQSFTVENYINIFKSYADLRSLLSYFGDGKSAQALGVFGELKSMLAEYFIGILAEHCSARSLSMRQAVRAKGGKAIFVEYDLSVGETLSPMYRLLIDLALKEALGQERKSGNVFVIADEFKLLPKLQHIDDALNFGRGLGVKVMAGIQSISQLYDIYGADKGAVLASGFGSMFAFHTNDASSRDYIKNRFGRNFLIYDYKDQQQNRVVYKEREGYTVEDWDLLNLGVGEAVVGLGYAPPFPFRFNLYE